MPSRADMASPAPSTPGRTVADLGERGLIKVIRSLVPPAPPWLILGIGDDAAVVEPERNTVDVLTTDALLETVHFDRRFTSAADVGWKALAVNLSDLAAMGATPRAALLSLALPAGLAVEDVEALVRELVGLATMHKMALAGGNIARSPGPLVVDVTATGSVRRRKILTRAGARPGEELFVSGSAGLAAAGLEWLRMGAEEGHAGEDSRAAEMAPAIARYLRPEPRVRLGTLLGRNRVASAAMDTSDGLGDAIRQLTGASGVGAVVSAEALPLDPGVRRWYERHDRDPVAAALQGGEDYELLFTVPRSRRRRFEALKRLVGRLPLSRIGVTTADGAVVLRRDGRDEPLPEGFVHFKERA